MIPRKSLMLSLVTLLVMSASASAQTPAPQCVDINTAGLEALQEIIHIGPARAQQIIALRAQRPFASVDELARVNGIAAARMRDIRAQGIACVGAVGVALGTTIAEQLAVGAIEDHGSGTAPNSNAPYSSVAGGGEETRREITVLA